MDDDDSFSIDGPFCGVATGEARVQSNNVADTFSPSADEDALFVVASVAADSCSSTVDRFIVFSEILVLVAIAV